jgi:hypothetical protein
MARSIGSVDSTPNLTNGSISTCEDIESGYSSREEGNDHAKDQLIVPKCITVGGYTRRLSLCENLPVRRHSKLETSANRERRQQETELEMQRHCFSQQKPDDETSKLKPLTILLGITLIVLTVGVTYFSQQSRIQSLHQQVDVLHQARRHVEDSHSKLSRELLSASHNLVQYKSTHERMKKINDDMTQHMKQLKQKRTGNSNEFEREAQRRLQNIIDSIRAASARQVLQKYGPGPHQVELDVKLTGYQDFQTIRLDLASIDITDGMPHAVHTFLEQVDAKAWDGASFGFHAGHVLLAVPSETQDSNESANPIPTVLFPEYSHKYPHEEYTVAFPGRPGTGQDFYINLKPNVLNHSPRMQDGKFIEGEPCFARISDESSRRIIDEMDKIPVNRNGSLSNRVVIHEARIVGIDR